MMRVSCITSFAIAAFILSGCSYFDSAFVKACEEELTDRLRSPSTYERIELVEDEERLTADEYFSENRNRSEDSKEFDLRSINEGRSIPRRLIAFFTYEAANAYGTPIRNVAKCEYVTLSDDPEPFKTLVKLNGKNTFEYLREMMKQ